MRGSRWTREVLFSKCYRVISDRCTMERHAFYHRYGGRGIRICERWLHSFENFVADMGLRPVGTSLDRHPDNDGNYEPGNCRWATQREQMSNASTAHQLTINGRTATITEWSRISGVSRWAIAYRIKRGMSPADAIARPSRGRRQKCG